MLTFDEPTHEYRYAGTPVVSVTQAIGAAGLIDATWFTDYARDRGRAVHLATQFDDEGTLDEATVPSVIEPYLRGWRKFKDETGFVPEMIETRLCALEFGYAGTLDRVGVIDKKQRVLLDIKTNSLPCWGKLQTAAYCNGLPNGAALTRYVVQLLGTGDYKIHRYDVKDFRSDLADFLAVVRTAQLQREYRKQV